MANKRIKDLSTTAAVTASDDFIAVDGATNGTRKLDAYSPTFGGNLTVSGTGTSTFASNLTLNGSKILTVNGSGNLVQIGDASGTVAILLNRLNTSSNSNFYWLTAGALKWAVGLGINAVGEDFEFYSYPAGNTLLKLGSTTGNLLLGTTTDSGNGKLQLATHTTSAGGIGFGTDTSLYRISAGRVVIDHLGGSLPLLALRENGSSTLEIYTTSGVGVINTKTAKDLQFNTNNTLALTLDTSQNATLAGNYFYVGGGTSFYLRATGSGNGIWYGNNVSVDANYFNVRNQAGSTIYLSVDSTGSAFAGTIATQGGTASTPASASATGTAGTIRWDASYIYVCTAANTWKRVAIATW